MGTVGEHLVGTLHETEGVGGPEVETLDVVAEAEVETIGEAIFDNEVGEVVHRLLEDTTWGIGCIVAVVDLVGVHVEELMEMLDIDLGVASEVGCEVVLYADNEVLRLLHTRGERLALEGEGHIELAGTREEAVEEVDDIVVATGVEEDLAVEASCHLDTEAVGGVPFGREARFELWVVERGIVDETQTRVDEPAVADVVVGAIEGDIGGVLVLRLGHEVLVGEDIVGGVAFEAHTHLEIVFAEEIGDVDRGIEAADLAALGTAREIVEAYLIVGEGYGAVDERRHTGHESEVGAESVVLPMEVGDGLIAVDTVVEAETEEAEFAARAGVERQLAIDVEEIERHAAFHIGIEDG